MACHNPEEYVGDLLETHGLPRPSHEDLGNPNRPIIRRKIDQQSKPPNEEKTPGADVITGDAYQTPLSNSSKSRRSASKAVR